MEELQIGGALHMGGELQTGGGHEIGRGLQTEEKNIIENSGGRAVFQLGISSQRIVCCYRVYFL